MTEIEKKIVEFYIKEKSRRIYLRCADFSEDIEITFNGKTEYFSKEKLMDLIKDVKHKWEVYESGVFLDPWLKDRGIDFNWLTQNCLISHFKKLEQSNE